MVFSCNCIFVLLSLNQNSFFGTEPIDSNLPNLGLMEFLFISLLQKLHKLLLILHCGLCAFLKKLLDLGVRCRLGIFLHLAVGGVKTADQVAEIL